jgi:hypothetical protein
MIQIKLFKENTPDMEKFEQKVNSFLSEHADNIVVRDIKYSVEYPNPNNKAWANWTAMIIYDTKLE